MITNEYIKVILQLLEERCPNKKKVIYTNKYYLDKIILVLKDAVSWKSLSRLYPTDKKYHYKTIQDIFLKWSKLNIFEDAYNLLLNKYILPKYSYKSNIDLFIDTANISNKYGQELAKFGQNKKKKVTKISLITSHDKIPLSVSFYAGNIHDVKTIEPSLSHITNKLKYNNINLIGDKGYISNDIKQKLKHININLVTYSKANQKIKNSSYELT